MHEPAAAPQSAVTPARVAGTVALLIVLPAFVYYLWDCLTFHGGQPALPSAAMLRRVPPPTLDAAAIVVGWLAFQALLHLFAPGRRIAGAPLSDGTRLSYRMNGWASWWISVAVLTGGAALGLYRPAALADRIGPLLTTASLVAVAVSLFGRRSNALGRERVTGNAVCDFWLGTALNPRIGTFDLKLFFEARPGLIAWVVLDAACACKQYELHGVVSVPMLLVCAFHAWYVADYFKHEPAILSTWDVRRENFGFMLCFGNLVWVPFTYTIQAYYLIDHLHDLPWWAVAGIVAMNAAGYVMFRGANQQKHGFRGESRTPGLGPTAGHHPQPAGLAATRLRLVGPVAPYELSRRPADGARLVPAVRLRKPAALFLRGVSWDPASAPRTPRPRLVRGPLRRGLASVLRQGALSHRARRVLRPGRALARYGWTGWDAFAAPASGRTAHAAGSADTGPSDRARPVSAIRRPRRTSRR